MNNKIGKAILFVAGMCLIVVGHIRHLIAGTEIQELVSYQIVTHGLLMLILLGIFLIIDKVTD